MRLYWLLAALVFVALLATVHIYALVHFLYWRFLWLDNPVHFLGGLFMGTAVVGVLGRFQPRTYFIAVLAGAIGWEIFEFFINVEHETGIVLDTIADLSMDAFGSILAYGVARMTIWR